ncbi:MAG TPA: hydrogenase maturation protease [Terriglobia bacterium]|nr:hydrogenase maturation protease [Terriglobia bacterium]
MAKEHPQLLIIGVGNLYRSDDAAGVLVARRLKEAGRESFTVLEQSGEGASLMEAWKGVDAVLLIDAVSSGSPPGTIHRLEPARHPLPARMFQNSTHAFSLPQAIEMARALDEFPAAVIVFGIEGQNFQAGTELSPEVSKALPELVRRVLEETANIQSKFGDGD